MTRIQCIPARLDQYVNHDPRLIFKARLVFKARPLLAQLRQTPGLYSRPGLYLRPGFYSRKYGIRHGGPDPPCEGLCHELCINSWTNQDAVWGMDSGGCKEACVRWECTLAQPGKYNWIIHVKLLWPLLQNWNILIHYILNIFFSMGFSKIFTKLCPASLSMLHVHCWLLKKLFCYVA